MKNYSRAYNRHKQHVKFIRRVKNWLKRELNSENVSKALDGEILTFLRTTGKPCSCDMCTYPKYKRVSQHKILQEELKQV